MSTYQGRFCLFLIVAGEANRNMKYRKLKSLHFTRKVLRIPTATEVSNLCHIKSSHAYGLYEKYQRKDAQYNDAL